MSRNYACLLLVQNNYKKLELRFYTAVGTPKYVHFIV